MIVNIVWMRYYKKMMSDVRIWLDRLSSLHKSQMRKAACAAGMQLVHLEILQYLSMCNRYSNTAQALGEYLGQTKGSLSQSLAFMEEAGYIERKPDPVDRRYARLSLTKEGKALLKRINAGNILVPDFPEDDATVETIQRLLSDWQSHNGLKSFGQCKSCRFNKTMDGGRSQCMLTGEALSKSDVRKICREHEFSDSASAPVS